MVVLTEALTTAESCRSSGCPIRDLVPSALCGGGVEWNFFGALCNGGRNHLSDGSLPGYGLYYAITLGLGPGHP